MGTTYSRSLLQKVGGLFFLGALTLSFVGYSHYRALHPSTEDAYVRAHVVHMAVQVPGRVSAVHVKNHQVVKKGQVLFEIDRAPFEQMLKEAKANLQAVKQGFAASKEKIKAAQSLVASRQAELDLLKAQSEKELALVKRRVLPAIKRAEIFNRRKMAAAGLAAAQEQFSGAKVELGSLNAQDNPAYKAAKAMMERAALQLAYTRVIAPADGILAQFKVRVGTVVLPHSPLFALIENKQWWVEANFKETDLTRLRVGQPATVTLDVYPGHVFQGRVASISAGSGDSFSLLPTENATGNWVKVTQRFAVKIRIDDLQLAQYPLRMGGSCTVKINTVSS